MKLEKKMSVNSSNEEKPATPTRKSADENAVCEECGKFGAYQIGDHFLCMDCYQGKGSCCPEFGKDDLWEDANRNCV